MYELSMDNVLRELGFEGQVEILALLGFNNIEFNKKIVNVLRNDDNNPGCRFVLKNNGVIELQDYASTMYGNVVNLYSKVNNINVYEACLAINDLKALNLGYDKTYTKSNTYIPKKIESPAEVKKEPPVIKFISSTEKKYFNYFYPISYETLMRENVMAGLNVWITHPTGITETFRYTDKEPCFIYKDGENVTVYKPLSPKNKKWRKNGLFYYGLNTLTNERPIIVTKSKKDMMVLRECGFNAYSVPQENIKQIPIGDICIFDNDKAGRALAETINLPSIWLDDCKDAFEYANTHGLTKLKFYINEAIGNNSGNIDKSQSV